MPLKNFSSLPLKAFWAYVVCTVGDFVSSLGRPPEGIHETNPFSRHSDGSFWPSHALANIAIGTFDMAVISLGLGWILGYINRKLALFVMSWPWLWLAYEHFQAAITNIQLRFLFVPYVSPQDVLEFLKKLGGVN